MKVRPETLAELLKVVRRKPPGEFLAGAIGVGIRVEVLQRSPDRIRGDAETQ